MLGNDVVTYLLNVAYLRRHNVSLFRSLIFNMLHKLSSQLYRVGKFSFSSFSLLVISTKIQSK